MEATDVLISEYRIDGGAWTVFSLNGSLSDDFTSKMVQQTLLNGLTLEIRILMKNTANVEKHQIDNLRVAGTPYQPPSAPTITSLTEGDSHLIVYFSQGSDGGSAVTDIEYSIDGGITWISTGSVSSPISIIGLTNGMSYDVRVRAINVIGNGDPSLGMIGTPIASSTKPVLDFQNASFLSTNTATLGATILSDGGESISSRGTLWSTSPQPNTNQLAEGGTAVGDFQHLRTEYMYIPLAKSLLRT
jgi:titin